MATSSILKTIVIDKKEDAEMLVNALEEAEDENFHVVYYINGIATEKRWEQKVLMNCLMLLTGKLLEDSISDFFWRPFSHENLIYSHHK